jgi:hypothetical protein
MGDYHLASGSPAIGRGAPSQLVSWGSWTYTVSAPANDIDGNNPRPTIVGSLRRYDAGSDQAP